MKRPILLLLSVMVFAAGAAQIRAQDTLESEFGARLGKGGVTPSNETNPNEIVKGNVAYSGIAVDLLTTDNPLQLINPFAPAKYGSAEDNTFRDSVTGRALGLKFLSIRF